MAISICNEYTFQYFPFHVNAMHTLTQLYSFTPYNVFHNRVNHIVFPSICQAITVTSS